MSEAVRNSTFTVVGISKSDVEAGDLSTLNYVIKMLTKNKELMLDKKASVEIFFPEYDSDPRELYEIPEVRDWFLATVAHGVPWFYFLDSRTGVGLTLLLCSTCEVSLQGIHENKYQLFISLEQKQWWFEHNFITLNEFTEANKISIEINKQISEGIANWYIQNHTD